MFKNLPHPVGKNWLKTKGEQVIKGYFPDVTVFSPQNKLKYIIELERKTDRKAFIGDLVKAEMFSEIENAYAELIIVMKPAPNTTTKQIATHLSTYRNWIAKLKGGKSNLSSVQILSISDYEQAVNQNIEIGTKEFKLFGIVL